MRQGPSTLAAFLAVWFGILLICPQTSFGAKVVGLRYWTAPDHTRIVIDLSSSVEYTHDTRTGPHRIVVEIPQTVFANKYRKIEIGDGLVDRIRTNQLRSGKAQVVLDLPDTPSYKIFSLKKVSGKPDRIVIDVLRTISEAEKAEIQEHVKELRKKNKAIVVIDPGHGGEDPGAVGKGKVYEKDVVFKVSREIARILDKDPWIEVFLTRKDDYFVSLKKRQEIACELDADLFVSIHANAAPARSARGAEVFFLSMSGVSDAATRALAESENSADMVGGVSVEARDDIGAILCDLGREGTLRRSSDLAEIIYDEFRGSNLTRMRKVKQAGFGVLKTIQMAAVLVELGFLSNSDDRKKLQQSSHQRKLAQALASSIRRYVERYPPGGGVVHVVERGESLWVIAEAHRTTVNDLKKLNDLGKSDTILIGQKLRVH